MRRSSSASRAVAGRRAGLAARPAAEWDPDADDYQAEHGEFLGDGDFVWCPEGAARGDARLLGDVAGAGSSSRLRARPSARGGWRRGGPAPSASTCPAASCGTPPRRTARTGVPVPLVQADARPLPFGDGPRPACSAFGALPFVADGGALLREVARVLRPGGRWVFAVNHPMRWMFPDDPGPDGLVVRQSYFDRTPYVEVDDHGAPPTSSTTAPWATGCATSSPPASCWTTSWSRSGPRATTACGAVEPAARRALPRHGDLLLPQALTALSCLARFAPFAS